jgi:hypothetical protein
MPSSSSVAGIHSPALELQVSLGRIVVIVGPDLDPRVRRQPLRHHPDAVALEDIAQDQPLEPRRLHVLRPELLERHLAAEGPFEQAAHRLLPGPRKEDLGAGMELARQDHRGRGVEVRSQVGGDHLHW